MLSLNLSVSNFHLLDLGGLFRVAQMAGDAMQCSLCRTLSVENLTHGLDLGSYMALKERCNDCQICRLVVDRILDSDSKDISESSRIRIKGVSGELSWIICEYYRGRFDMWTSCGSLWAFTLHG